MSDDAPAPPPASWRRRVGWLILIWAASVAALAVVTFALKGLMQLAGSAT